MLCSCNSDRRINGFNKVKSHYTTNKIGTLPSVVNESSGLAKGNTPHSFWTNNDSGGKAELYEIDSTGRLLSIKKIVGAENKDWEELTTDDTGAVYIGDFGNNGNDKRTMDIYKVPANDSISQKITFRYADQTAFPPPPEQKNYDCEAFFYRQNSLYLFSKNRSSSNHYVRMYKMPVTPGDYTISATDSIQIKTQVTSADISPDGKTFALLTYGKILLFGIESNTIDFRHPLGCFKFAKKQTEALIFLNNTDMLVTNEQGQIFRLTHR